MRSVTLLLSLLASTAFAQAGQFCRPPCGAAGVAGVDGGVMLGVADYETTGALTLFVAPTGNDSNACTASGASACLTLQGAENRIPKGIRHPVSVTVATGNYTGLTVNGHWFDPVSVTNGAYINWTAAYVAATVATGSASGTATGGSQSAGAGVVFGTLGDSTQTWTVNDLKGKILERTGGAGSGETRVIVSNTATVVTIAGSWTLPVAASSTYAIRSWGAVVNTAVNQPAIPTTAAGTPLALRVANNGSLRSASGAAATVASSPITFNRLKFAPGTAAQGAVSVIGPSAVAFSECSINGNTSGASLQMVNGPDVQVDRSYLASTTTGIAAGTSSGAVTGAVYGQFRFSFSLAESTSTTAVMSIGSTGNWASNQINSNASGAASVVTGSFSFNGGANWVSTVVQCTAGGSTVGVNLQGAEVVAHYEAQLNNYAILSCPTGLQVKGNSVVTLTTAAGTSVITGTGAQTTGINVNGGGKVLVLVDPTISGYTNDLTVQGITSTYAAFLALTPTAIFDLNYGSTIQK